MNMTVAQDVSNPSGHSEPRDLLRSARFRLEREAHWKRLDDFVTRIEKSGDRLDYQETREMVASYRQAMTSLSVARDISLDRALVDYLERLCARAYLVVYAPQEGLGGLMTRLLSHGIPQAVRRSGAFILIAFLALLIGAAVGYHLYTLDTKWFYSFMPDDLGGGRTPDSLPDYLRDTLYDDDTSLGSELAAFSSSLFSHNTEIAIMVFTLGIFWALPSLLLTFYNGLILGVFFAMFADKGLGYDVFAWLSIHGVTELSAVVIACAGGARLGWAMLMPGAGTRGEALRREGHDAVKLVILAGLMLIVAGVIEGVLRQRILDPQLRLAIGWGVGCLWALWLGLSGRDTAQAQSEDAR